VATGVSPSDLEAFVEKLVRGLTCIQLQRLIEPPYVIQMQLLAPQDAWIFNDQLDKFGIVVDRSPAIRARVARAASDPLSAIYEFVIWERLSVHAYVMVEGGLEEDRTLAEQGLAEWATALDAEDRS
jgi:hypothetical protein